MSSLHPLAFFFGGSPSPSEILFILVAALLLFGARRLPDIARNLGKSMETFRRAARDITDEIMHADPEPPQKKSPELPPPPNTVTAQEGPLPPASDEADEEDKDTGNDGAD